jgi:hypothetical protein
VLNLVRATGDPRAGGGSEDVGSRMSDEFDSLDATEKVAIRAMGPKAHLLRRMDEPVTLCLVGGHAGLACVPFVYRRYRKI